MCLEVQANTLLLSAWTAGCGPQNYNWSSSGWLNNRKLASSVFMAVSEVNEQKICENVKTDSRSLILRSQWSGRNMNSSLLSALGYLVIEMVSTPDYLRMTSKLGGKNVTYCLFLQHRVG